MMKLANKYARRYKSSEVDDMDGVVEIDAAEVSAAKPSVLKESKAERRSLLSFGLSSVASAAPAASPFGAAAPAAPAAAPAPAAAGGLFDFFAPAPAPVPPPVAEKPKKVIRSKVDANVVAVSLGTLGSKADKLMETGDPFFCRNEKCGAVLSVLSAVVDEDKGSKVWICEFCGCKNVVDIVDEEIPCRQEDYKESLKYSGHSVDFVLEPPEDGAGGDAKDESSDGTLIFCIDISGSMCVSEEVPGSFKLKTSKKKADEFADLLQPGDVGYRGAGSSAPAFVYVSRLEAVQAAIDSQMELLAKTKPNTKVVVIAFSTEVTVLGNGINEPLVVAGGKLKVEDTLKAIGGECASAKPIKDIYRHLSERVLSLEPKGQTCLGPALLVALGIANKSRGSRVVMCTDGLANIGPGALADAVKIKDEVAIKSIGEWYEKVANEALIAGTTIDVISIKGDECYLEMVGKLADITRGNVERVDITKIKDNFAGILEKSTLATNVSATMLIHGGLKFRDEADVVIADLEEKMPEADSGRVVSKRTQFVGNAQDDTEIFFEYETAKEKIDLFKDLKELPFQVQIRYTKLDGSKCIRIISSAQILTSDESELRKCLDHSVLAANAAVKSAALAQAGEYEKSRALNKAWRGFLEKTAVTKEQHAASAMYAADIAEFDDDVASIQRGEEADALEATESYITSRAVKRSDKDAERIYAKKKVTSSKYK